MSTWSRIALAYAADQGELKLHQVAGAFGYRHVPAVSDRTEDSTGSTPVETTPESGELSSIPAVRPRLLRIWRLDRRTPRQTEPCNHRLLICPIPG